MMRASGILMPIFSLASEYGIGCFDEEAYQFVDMLEAAGQSYWQILPLGPTGYGDSPYQSFSTFAGNPYFISLNELIKEKLLTREECQEASRDDTDRIDYQWLYHHRFLLLKKAFERSNFMMRTECQKFIADNEDWLEDYARFMALKEANGGEPFDKWDDDLKIAKERLSREMEFIYFQQYYFYHQWSQLKHYANEKGIKIIGDIPIYVARDSADCWANPQLFQFDVKMQPICVAGCPPDQFSKEGQLWGNPLYDWKYNKRSGYRWWIKRIAHCLKLYDVIRIDHFRGFDSYYAIPYGEKSAVYGKWEEGPGIDFFHVLQEHLPEVQIIAEDLGFLTDSVRALLEKTGYPGMKVLQFAFETREESDYRPHLYDQHCVVYTGTHDNDTTLGLISQNSDVKQMMLSYLQCENTITEKDLLWKLICLAMSSVAELCIIPMQDYLALGSEARINTPSTMGNNWMWRLKKFIIGDELIHKIKNITNLYTRINKSN